MLDGSYKQPGDIGGRQSDVAFELLKADIVRCEIAPGAEVSEAALGKRYGVGTAGVRTALVRLSERGWLRALPRRGYRVAPVTLRDVREVFEMRRIVEPAAARLAAGRGEIERLTQLDAICEAGYTPGDRASEATFLQAHRQLHVAVVLAAGNGRLAQAIERLWDEVDRLLHLGRMLRDRPQDLRCGHAALIAALGTGDAAAAGQAALDEVEQTFRTVIDTVLRSASAIEPDQPMGGRSCGRGPTT